MGALSERQVRVVRHERNLEPAQAAGFDLRADPRRRAGGFSGRYRDQRVIDVAAGHGEAAAIC